MPNNLKRTASKAALAPSSPPPSSARPSFITPKKTRPSGYSGPIYDPNPVNPFAVTPPKPSPFTTDQPGPSTSPFIHASSPKKLKEVLQLNSLRKVRERDGVGSPLKEITPRTRARKRLRGDVVDDTPMKDRLPRRKRGEGGKQGMTVEIQDEELEEEDEDELGPSPFKSMEGANRTFTSLLVEAEVVTGGLEQTRRLKGKEKGHGSRGRSNEMMVLFGRAAQGEKMKTEKKEEEGKTPHVPRQSTPPVNGSPKQAFASDPPLRHPSPDLQSLAVGDEGGSSEELPTPPSDPVLEAAASQVSPSKPIRPINTLSLSDDEEDEWDPEDGRAKRTISIVSTRRDARKAWSDDDLINNAVDEDDDASEEEAEEEEVQMPPLAEGTTATSTTRPSSPITTSLAPPLLSLLSLKSPSSTSKQSRLTDLRVKAIFNPLDATRLRAMKRGQEVYVPGEGVETGEDIEVMKANEMGGVGADDGGGEGDDDWESENEGWKRTGLGIEDEQDDW